MKQTHLVGSECVDFVVAWSYIFKVWIAAYANKIYPVLSKINSKIYDSLFQKTMRYFNTYPMSKRTEISTIVGFKIYNCVRDKVLAQPSKHDGKGKSPSMEFPFFRLFRCYWIKAVICITSNRQATKKGVLPDFSLVQRRVIRQAREARRPALQHPVNPISHLNISSLATKYITLKRGQRV